ncbi:MAG: alpha/beta fold hydrolase [Planctomycetes bacterium]|nr:alpha/beta fold hydrolase [Planctomycetota bacterium]
MDIRSLIRLPSSRLPGSAAAALALAAIFAGVLPSTVRACPSPAAPREGEPQRVTLATEDKLALVGTFYAPKDSKSRAPGVVLVHGAGGSRVELDALALRLQKSGFAALTIDLRGHGESATDALQWKTMDAEAQQRAWAFMSRDVKAGVDFLLDQKGVHSTTVSLLGRGAGAALVARQATRDDRVRDLVLLTPETEALASTLVKDLIDLAGLPVLVAFDKEQGAAARRFAEAVNRDVAGESTLETQVTKLACDEMLSDLKLASEFGRFMKSKALPPSAATPAR